LKVNPQSLASKNVMMIEEEEFREKLLECSIPSINYGQNFVFMNLDAYEAHFIQKL
jgi:hypothetical protein